ncbi:MAG: hypothetical protein Salg2KO_14840 [Salibacteraceae bacterium]
MISTVKLICSLIEAFAKDSGNKTPAIKLIPHAILLTWSWLLKSGLTGKKRLIQSFEDLLWFHLSALNEYFDTTFPVTFKNDGLYAPAGKFYEKVGYPMRTFWYISQLCYFVKALIIMDKSATKEAKEKLAELVVILIINNLSGIRPLLDNHSIAIHQVASILIEHDRREDVESFIWNTISAIHRGVITHNRFPDGNNQIESVIKFMTNGDKSVYYEETTSQLLGMLFEYLAILDMSEAYGTFKAAFEDKDLATYIPFKESSEDGVLTEVRLFEMELGTEGYQSEIRLDETFTEFKKKTSEKSEQDFDFETDKHFPFLRDLAHMTYKTPFFPRDWRRFFEFKIGSENQ